MEFPSKCPYCGKDNVNNLSTSARDQFGYLVEIHTCIHCSNPIFVIKNLNTDWKDEIIHYFPTVTITDFPKRIKKLSPNAYKAYEQTIKAKEQGLDMLVGAGLRIALEWLVWDYLVKINNCKETDLEKLTLAKRIEKMSHTFYTEVCTRLVRLFGNDSVHIIKQLDFSTEEVIEVFNMLCSLIDGELQIKEVNDRLPKKS